MSTNPDEAGALSPAERDFALRRMPVETFREAGRDAFGMPVQTLAEAYVEANRPTTEPAALIEWDVMHGALMELHSVAYRFFLLKRRAPGSPFAEAADELFALEKKLREALK